MDLNNILGTLGSLFGGKGKGTANADANAAEAGGLQDIIGDLNLSELNPQDIIAKFQNGEISKEKAVDAIKQVAATLGLDDELESLLNKLG